MTLVGISSQKGRGKRYRLQRLGAAGGGEQHHDSCGLHTRRYALGSVFNYALAALGRGRDQQLEKKSLLCALNWGTFFRLGYWLK
jgi:hypothetical protein